MPFGLENAFHRSLFPPLIDEPLKDQGWKITDGPSARFEHVLPDVVGYPIYRADSKIGRTADSRSRPASMETVEEPV